MGRVGAAGGMLADTVLGDTVLAGPVLAGPVLAGTVLAESGSVQPVHTANVAPPGEIVTAGHDVVVPSPHGTNWLVLIVSVVAGWAGVSVPESTIDCTRVWSCVI